MTADDFRYLRELVESHAGIFVEPGKNYLFESRLGNVARLHGYLTIARLVQQLRASAPVALHREVVEAMTTQETSFFRDGHPFEALRKVVLPELIARRAAVRRLTIWSAAASTGQEPYSVAMLLREHFPSLAGWDVKIIATDLCESVLARAGRPLQPGRGGARFVRAAAGQIFSRGCPRVPPPGRRAAERRVPPVQSRGHLGEAAGV